MYYLLLTAYELTDTYNELRQGLFPMCHCRVIMAIKRGDLRPTSLWNAAKSSKYIHTSMKGNISGVKPGFVLSAFDDGTMVFLSWLGLSEAGEWGFEILVWKEKREKRRI